MAPVDAPIWVRDRSALWNQVETAERRRDSQLARVIEAGLPVELATSACVALVRDFVAKEFVTEGMIADVNIRRDNPANPLVHIMLTLRVLSADGFGAKQRGWNGKARLLAWRSAWAAVANEHLARAGHDVRIDHRTLEAQHIELEPVRRVGFGRPLSERTAEQRRIAEENGAAILEDPGVLLRALTQQRATFSMEQLAQFLRSRTGPGQFDAAFTAVTRCDELIALKPDGALARFTSKDMIDAAKLLKQRMTTLAARSGHRVRGMSSSLDVDQQRAFDYLVAEGDVKAIAISQPAKQPLLDAVRQAWNASGWQVLDSQLHPPDSLSKDCILVVEGPEMLGLRELERLVAVVDRARAKLVMVADSQRFESMRSESPFHGVWREIGFPGRMAVNASVF